MHESPQPETPPLSHFWLLWGGQAVSLLGSQLVQFALIWWLTQETGSATVLATASLVGLLPQVILGPVIGALVDRWNRKAILFVADGLIALATVALALLFWTGAVQVWHIYALLLVRALAGGFHGPTMMATTALLVPPQHLTRVQGMNETLRGALSIVAAPLGALLLEALPMQGILAIDVVTAAFAIAPLAFVVVPQPRAATMESESKPSVWADVRAGLRYVLRWPAVLILIGMASVVNLLFVPAFSMLPLLVADHFGRGALELGWMQAAMGVGVVVGGLVLGAWGGFRRRLVTTLTGLIGLGLGVLAVGLVPAAWFPLAVGAMFAAGVMIPICNAPILATMQAAVAPEMQGRVFTLMGTIGLAMSPLGLIIAGPIADALGVRVWFVVGGAVCLAMGVLGFFIPAILNLGVEGSGEVAEVVASA